MERKTKQRDGILEILSQKNYHPNAEEIYNRMKSEFPKLGVATIYRNLEQLTKAGLIVKLPSPIGESARYDGNSEKHFHIRCINCGLVEDVWIDLKLEKKIDLKKIIPNFEVHDYKVDFWGKCKNCKTKKEQ